MTWKRESKFLLTRLMRGVTKTDYKARTAQAISTHTPHARRDELRANQIKRVSISTHTPHARRDRHIPILGICYIISTHTPHARRDLLRASFNL